MQNTINIHTNESANVNISLLKKFNINIEPKFYDKFMETLIKMVRTDCKKALSKFKLEDIIGSNSGEFFQTYLTYFDVYTPDSTIRGTRYLSVVDNFLSIEDRNIISGHYINNNLNKIKEKCQACLINEQEEFDKAMKNTQKMFDYFVVREFVKSLKITYEPKNYQEVLKPLVQGSIFDLIRLLQRPLYEFFTPSRDLKNNIQTREIEYFLSKYSKCIKKENRLSTYTCIIDSIKTVDNFKYLYYTGLPNTETEGIRKIALKNMKLCLEAIELKHFSKNSINIKEEFKNE